MRAPGGNSYGTGKLHACPAKSITALSEARSHEGYLGGQNILQPFEGGSGRRVLARPELVVGRRHECFVKRQ